MKNNKRKICKLCKSKKYIKFLRKATGGLGGYVCRKEKKCNLRAFVFLS